MKKFYTSAAIAALPEGKFQIELDGKPLHTPAKRALIVESEALAQAIADEWQAQGEQIDKTLLPMTSYASLAIDIAQTQRQALCDELLEYGETDLLFYHEDQEAALAERQQQQWQPWLEWAQQRYGTRYEVAAGVMPVSQPADNAAAHGEALDALDCWQLATLAATVKPTTSLILSLAFLAGELDAGQLYDLSRLEEQFNIERWGEDAEAAHAAESLKQELQSLERWRALL